jgi:hypothetical protein
MTVGLAIVKTVRMDFIYILHYIFIMHPGTLNISAPKVGALENGCNIFDQVTVNHEGHSQNKAKKQVENSGRIRGPKTKYRFLETASSSFIKF